MRFGEAGVYTIALGGLVSSAAVIWLNDGESARWTDLPHGRAEGFGGIAPQGALTISGDKLLVPGGRSVPACLDKNTGEFEYYRLSSNQKNGGDFVAANR